MLTTNVCRTLWWREKRYTALTMASAHAPNLPRVSQLNLERWWWGRLCRLVLPVSLTSLCLSSADPERWTNIPLLVKIFKLIINELSTVVEANASRANAADWSQGDYTQHRWHWLASFDRTHVFFSCELKNRAADISVTRCCLFQIRVVCGRTTKQKRGMTTMRRTKGLQGSSFLISSHPINTVPASPQCLTLSCAPSSAPGELCSCCSRNTCSRLSFHFLVYPCVTDDDYYEDDEEDDPDALKDPIYQINLQVGNHEAYCPVVTWCVRW